MLVSEILELSVKEVVGSLSDDQKEFLKNWLGEYNEVLFYEMYLDGARLSDQEEYFNTSEYLELRKELIEMAAM